MSFYRKKELRKRAKQLTTLHGFLYAPDFDEYFEQNRKYSLNQEAFIYLGRCNKLFCFKYADIEATRCLSANQLIGMSIKKISHRRGL